MTKMNMSTPRRPLTRNEIFDPENDDIRMFVRPEAREVYINRAARKDAKIIQIVDPA